MVNKSNRFERLGAVREGGGAPPCSLGSLVALAGVFLVLAGCRGGYVGDAVCLACHDGRTAMDMRSISDSPHANVGCETCHGPGLIHVQNAGRAGLGILNPASLSFGSSVGICTECHADAADSFQRSAHATGEAATCHDCHDVHTAGGMFLSPLDNSLCLGCHASMGFDAPEDVIAHAVYHPLDPAGTGAGRCTSCHMTPLQRQNQADGPRDHSMVTVPPEASNLAAEMGISPVPPNSCAGIEGCHDGSVPTAPVFDVDSAAGNSIVQPLYEAVGLLP